MTIIAKTTEGYLIAATENEVVEILKSVIGDKVEPKDIKMQTKIPAIDYAASITKIKNLKSSYTVTVLQDKINDLQKDYNKLMDVLNNVPSEL